MDSARLYKRFRQILPWIITVILLVIVFKKVGLRDTLDQLLRPEVREVVLLGFVFYTYVFFINSFSYYILFKRLERPIPYKEMLSIKGASYLLTALNPPVGQGGLALWISKKKNIPIKEVIGIMLILPVVDMMFLLGMLSASLLAHHLGDAILPPSQVDILTLTVVALCAILTFYFAFWRAGFMTGRFKKIRESLFMTGFRKAGLSTYAVLLGIRMVMNLPGIIAYYVAFIFFGVQIPFWVFVVRFFPALIIQSLPITIGQLGTSQSAWILMYKDYASAPLLAAFSLIWVSIFNISRFIIGAICFRLEAIHLLKINDGSAADETVAHEKEN